jgi:putative Mg2+ transporter-C (MgtC) family protein
VPAPSGSERRSSLDTLSHFETLERLGLSLLAGLILGFEREWRAKPAGLRTHALVCEGSALFMMGSLLLGEQIRKSGGTGYDPSRVASTVVQGIGFLAGGVILAHGGRVRGLTSAADIWVTAAIGVLIGSGFYFLSISATIATIVVLGPFRWLESRMTSRQVSPGLNNSDEARSELDGE